MNKLSLASLLCLLVVSGLFMANQAKAAEGSACASTADCVNTVCTYNSFVYDEGDGAHSQYYCSVNDASRPCTSFCGARTRTCLCGYSWTGRCDQPPSFDSNGNLVSLGDASGIGSAIGTACTAGGRQGIVYQTYCPNCGNGLTYCKPNAPAPKEEPKPKEKEPEKQPEKPKQAPTTTSTETPEPTAKPSYSGYCGDGVCDHEEESWCLADCLSPYGAYCTLSSYPKHVPVGGSSEINVRYFNALYPVNYAVVSCGNGQIMYAWNCGGRTGECYTQCRYYAPGVYTVTGFAGGVSCKPTLVYAGVSSTPTPTPSPTPKPTQTPVPSPKYRYPRCSVETLPPYLYGSGVSNIKIPYFDLENAPARATIICGNGEIVYGSCEGSAAAGNCVGSCAYAPPARYPWAYNVDAVVGGVQCAAGTVSILAGGSTPTPTATATAQPTGTLVVKVLREDGIRPLWGAVVRVPGRGDFRTGYDGEVEVAELNAGTLSLIVSADGYQTQRVSANVRGGETTRITVIMREAPSPTPTVTPTPTATATAQPRGALLVRVTNCANGAAVRGARVELYKQTVPRETLAGTYYSNEYGEALAQELSAGDYVAVVNANGYAEQRASGRVNAGQTNTLAVCLNAGGGGSGASCAITINPSSLGVNQTGAVSVDYYSFNADPESVRVDCGNGQTTVAQCNGHVNGHCNAGSCAYAAPGAYVLTASSAGIQCSSATASVTQGSGSGGSVLSLEALEASKTGYGGEKTCFALLLRNSGDSRAAVALSASAFPNNGWKTSFTGGDSFYVVPHEIKTIDFCVDVPEAASDNVAYAITARSAINDATASVSLRALGSSDFSLNYGGCFAVDANSGWVTRVVQVTNNAEDGNYEVELGGDNSEIGAEAGAVYGFKKGETRDVAIRFSTEGLDARNYYVDFKLRKKTTGNAEQGPIVFQTTVCVRPSGAGTGAVTLSPSSITVGRGYSQTASLRVKNTGSANARFYVSALKKTGLSVSVSPQYLTLDAGTEGAAEIKVSADADAPLGPVSVPVRVYNSAEYYGGYYGGGYYGNYAVRFECGNGETRSTQCGYGDGSCSVSCPYSSVGTYSPRAVLHGNSCASTVRVLDYYPANSLVLRAETPFIPSSGASVIRIDYYSLSGGGGNAPVITNVQVEERDTSADVFWDTDKGSNSRVDYAFLNGSEPHSEFRSGYVTQHQVTLTGLAPNEKYEFNVTSCDYDGRCSTDSGWLIETKNSTLGFSGSSEHGGSGGREAKPTQSVLYFDDLRTVRVNCGNGQTQTAYCSGSGGSCSVSCYYSSAGVFDVTASVDGASPTIYGTRVVVGRTDNEACYLASDPQTILDGSSATIKMNYYDVPNDGSGYGSGYREGYYDYTGLVDSVTLLVNVAAKQPEPQGGPLITQRLEIDAKTINAAPGTRTNAPATIRNKNYYDVPALVVYADGLPNGVTAKAVTPFSLAADEEKTIALEFDVGDVPAGDYEIALHAESAVAQAPVKNVKLRVRGAVGEAAASVSEPATSVVRNGERIEITLNFTIKNEAAQAKTLSAAIEGLPENWTYGMNPVGGATLAANETRGFTATIYAPAAAFDEYREYPATLAVSDENGKTKRVPLAINKGGASVLSGFFTALGGDYGLFVLLIILVAAGAALLYLAEEKTRQADEAKASSETSEASEAGKAGEESEAEASETKEAKGKNESEAEAGSGKERTKRNNKTKSNKRRF